MENYRPKRNIKAFDGEKYSVWKFRIRAFLTELDLIDVIDKDIPEEPSEDWKQSNHAAKSVLIEYLADSFLGFVKPELKAKEVFANLDKIYERKSLATQLNLRKKLLSLKLQGDVTLLKHFNVFDDIITELIAAGAKLDEGDKVSHLLLTLPPSYDGVITAIETLSEDNLTLAFVKTRLLDQEVKLSNESRDTSGKVLQVEAMKNIGSRFNSNNKRKPFLGKDKFNNKKFKTDPKSLSVKCHHCGRKGHYKNKCYYYLKGLQYNKNKNNERVKTAQTVQINNPNDQSNFAFMAGENVQDISSANKIRFILDSGASDHIINREDLTQEFQNLQTPIKISVAKTGTFINATKKESLRLISNMGVEGVLENVLYSPDIPHNLMSVPKMQRSGLTIIFDNQGVVVCKEGKAVMKGKPLNNLIIADFGINTSIINTANRLMNFEIWHQRLGHIGKNKFLELKNKQMVDDVAQIKNVVPNDNICEACISGKQSRLPFNKEKNKDHIRRPLFIVHSDVCGPITPPTIDEKNYFIIFVDQYTHYCVTYLIKYKSDVFTMFKDYVAKSEAHFNSKLVNLYIDNGREYLSNEMKEYCVQKGITFHLTIPRTPQLNGVSERMIRTVTEKARAMIASASLDKMFWGKAVLTATYLINITPTRALKQTKTPYELWHNKKPQIKYLKVFGSTVFVHNKTSKTKFDDKSCKGILIGYEPNGYLVWNVEKDKFITVRGVIVDEMNFLKTRPILKSKGTSSMNDNSWDYDTENNDKLNNELRSTVEVDKSKNFEKELELDEDKIPNNRIRLDTEKENKLINDSQKEQIVSQPRRSERIKNCPPVSYNENCIQDYMMCAQSLICKIPTSYEEIKIRDDKKEWEQAIQDEINSLLANKTWELVKMPENKNIVDCKWVFEIKNDEFGNPMRCKARLVARGFTQRYLIDYDETFAPVARITSFRYIIAFANQFKLLIHHMDVKTAFLNGTLKEEIYMKVPQGIKGEKDQVCKLNKALYGLKQAARCWFEVFEKALIEKGFKNSSVDKCIYILDRGSIHKNIYVVLYVDDLVIVTEDINTMNIFKNYLKNKFSMVDLKEIKLFLGIRIIRENSSISLDQSAYINTVLKKFNMYDCNSVNTPLESKVNFDALNLEEKYDAPCRNLIGCLMYIMICTRPDLCIALNILSRYMNKNNKEVWRCLKRVLRYLKGSSDLKLTYLRNSYKNILVGYVDSDWGGDQSDRRSTTGYIFKLFETCTISWCTKKQNTVAASSTEAEYMALYEAVREALWLKSLSNSINMNINEPILINEDNNGCISIAKNPSSHKRSKHIDIKYHFSREQVEKKLITLQYIPTGEQIADTLTKSLPGARFLELRVKMGLK